ncbi:SLATT domain-containing protein [Gluconacetobacter entanii]|uniref:SLATT domain-containing protein n=1 Tax=Gluconacetobacter entanii TaxID=108528 RepID=UPI001C935378|nr:SLATT domain-containing protein [Gluconacetobacter entanii]MBY4639055.1 SLATT domain-containing protein [Gluconacetobacter entanii]MCW4579497.1 SLATT domain-containing protein [Gluconacetobacter entanii]MCW4582904.1 SLATT domain-containing protein [Gluconacetobacter entanii]MCW4586331.1 SLATT domain-containing protein [Gluconacetobacter entanii]
MALLTPKDEAVATLEGQLRECFARLVYSHKTHEKQGDLCAETLRRFKIGQIALSAITTSGTLAVLFTEDFLLKAMTALVSLITLFISGYMKGFDPGAVAQKHRDTAADMWAIRESYLSLLTDLMSRTIDEKTACERRDQLQDALAAIYKSAPRTTPKAYRLAQKALQMKEDYTFNPGEIDKFLPPALKRG